MDVRLRFAGYAAAALILAQSVVSLMMEPSAGENYSGSTADALNDSLWAAGLVLLGLFLVVGSRRVASSDVGAAISGVGSLLLSASVLVTVAAGEERWDFAFIVGFVLFELGNVVSLVRRRRVVPAAMALGMVLALAFFSTAGAFVLGVATIFLVRDSAGVSEPTRAASSARTG
jgi:hypothetical protein